MSLQAVTAFSPVSTIIAFTQCHDCQVGYTSTLPYTTFHIQVHCHIPYSVHKYTAICHIHIQVHCHILHSIYKYTAIYHIPYTSTLPYTTFHIQVLVHPWNCVLQFIFPYHSENRRSQWPRGLRRRFAAARLLILCFRIPPGRGCLSVVSIVCCQVEVSATSRSLVQGSPTDCGASLCVI